MSVNLFQTIVKTLKQSQLMPQLLKVPTRHFVTLMDTVPEKTTETSADVSNKKETDVSNENEVIRNKNSSRYKKRWYERKWEDPKPRNSENGQSDEKKLKTEERIKRKKMAMLLGYCGADYYGMQRNPGVPTIEEELLKALWDAKYITEDDFNNQQNAQFQRSSRTDKGVSAAGQVVSLKLPLEVDIEAINSRLPACIRVFDVARVTNRFNAKLQASARSYSYTLPTFALSTAARSSEERQRYRLAPETLQRLNEVLAEYKGTKSYHNFTEKKFYNDPSASRYMLQCGVQRVFEHGGHEFAVIVVQGQSFMLHQIRKMVGVAVALVRGGAAPDTLQRAFGPARVMLPTAPADGLVLDEVHYSRYAAAHTGHDALSWERGRPAAAAFRLEVIDPHVVTAELTHQNVAAWLDKLDAHVWEPSEQHNEVVNQANEQVVNNQSNDQIVNNQTVNSQANDHTVNSQANDLVVNQTNDQTVNPSTEHATDQADNKDAEQAEDKAIPTQDKLMENGDSENHLEKCTDKSKDIAGSNSDCKST